MELNLGEYKIITDERNFIVQKKRATKAFDNGHIKTKEENVGKVNYIDIAYCSTLEQALRFIENRIMIDNNDIVEIKKELIRLENNIREFIGLLKFNV